MEIVYIRDNKNIPRTCVAIDCSGEQNLVIATSTCHDKDQCVKAIGRAKAIGRLNSVKYQIRVPRKIVGSFSPENLFREAGVKMHTISNDSYNRFSRVLMDCASKVK